MSCGLAAPSMSGSPARILSPSRTARCLPLEMRYSLGSPRSGVMSTLRLPLVSLPKLTVPSISAMTACSLGLRDSNSSATRGRPPVMSLVFVVSRGIRAMMSPASIVSPSVAAMVEPTGRKYRASFSPLGILSVLPCSSLSEMRGRSSASFDSR